MSGTLTERIAEAWSHAFGYVRDRQQAWRTTRELDALDQYEATRTLSEAGLGRADFRDVASRPFAFEDLMAKGMNAIGIDARSLAVRHGEWYRCLEHTCAVCTVRGHCHRVIERSQFAEGYREFCPNSGEFDYILANRAGGSPAPARSRPQDMQVTGR